MADQCAECGFTYDVRQAAVAGDDIRERIAEVVAILRNSEVDVRSRSRPEAWSPLEYGCHLRDVLLVQRERGASNPTGKSGGQRAYGAGGARPARRVQRAEAR